MPITGGPTEGVAKTTGGTAYLLACDATGVYWVDGPGTPGDHRVVRLGPDGLQELASQVQYPLGIALGKRGVLFTDQYPSVDNSGAINVVDREGGSVVALSADGLGPAQVFERDGFDYWVERHDEGFTNHGGIARVPVDGGAREKVLTLNAMYPVAATTDGERYFLTGLEEQLGTALVTGDFPISGTPTILASISAEDEFFTAVAVTDRYVVWTVQPGLSAAGQPVDGVRSICKRDIP